MLTRIKLRTKSSKTSFNDLNENLLNHIYKPHTDQMLYYNHDSITSNPTLGSTLIDSLLNVHMYEELIIFFCGF